MSSKESEEKLKKLKEKIRASINWVERAKWIAEGQPYEEHEKILMFLNKDEPANSRSDGNSLIYTLLSYIYKC